MDNQPEPARPEPPPDPPLAPSETLLTRLRTLEDRLARLEEILGDSPSAPPRPNLAPQPEVIPPPLPPAPARPQPQQTATKSNPTPHPPEPDPRVQDPRAPSSEETYFGAKILPWIGAAVVATGVFALVSYAIAIGFFTPPIQFAASLLLAAALLTAGIRTTPTAPDFADILKGLAALVAFLAFAAGHVTWKLYEGTTAVAALFAVAAACYLYADRRTKVGFAILGFFGITFTSFFVIASPEQGRAAVLTVLFLSLALTSAIAARNRWSTLAVAGYISSILLFTFILVSKGGAPRFLDFQTHITAVLALLLIPLAATLAALRPPKQSPEAQTTSDHQTPQSQTPQSQIRDLRTIAVALYAFAHYFVVLVLGPKDPVENEFFNTPLAGSFALLVALASLAIRLSPAKNLVHGTWLAVGFGLFLAPYTAETELRLAYFCAFALLAPIFALAQPPSQPPAARRALTTVNFVASLFAGLHYAYFLQTPPFPVAEIIPWSALFASVLFSIRLASRDPQDTPFGLGNGINALVGAVLLTQAARAILPSVPEVPWASTPLTVLLALWSTAILVAGFPLRDSSLRAAGFVGLLFVSGKIIAYDLSLVPPLPRIAVSLAVGLGLIALSYFLYIRPTKTPTKTPHSSPPDDKDAIHPGPSQA